MEEMLEDGWHNVTHIHWVQVGPTIYTWMRGHPLVHSHSTLDRISKENWPPLHLKAINYQYLLSRDGAPVPPPSMLECWGWCCPGIFQETTAPMSSFENVPFMSWDAVLPTSLWPLTSTSFLPYIDSFISKGPLNYSPATGRGWISYLCFVAYECRI